MLGRKIIGWSGCYTRAALRGNQTTSNLQVSQPFIHKRNYSLLLINNPTYSPKRPTYFSIPPSRGISTLQQAPQNTETTLDNTHHGGTSAPVLDGTSAPVLDGTSAPVLDGTSAPALDTSTPTLDTSTPAFQPDPQILVEATQATPYLPVGEITPHAGSVFSPLINFTSDLVSNVHILTGLPWWLSIALATFMVRTALLPVMIKVLRDTGKMQALKPQMDVIMARPRESQEAAMKMQQELWALMKAHNVSPFTGLRNMLFQAPVFILFFSALRSMAERYPSFHNGGALWFTDLTIPDPYYSLPAITGLLFIINFELGADGMGATPQKAVMKNIMRFMGIMFVPISATFPAALTVYWTANSFYSIFQALLLKIRPLRKLLKIPDPPPPVAPPTTITIPTVTYTSKPTQNTPPATPISPPPKASPTPAPSHTFTETESTSSASRRRHRRGGHK